ncbi:MAG TPA: nucleotidyltransferase domain-containing protein [Spirochaetota bacterium]|nr:nucleotidyltransferase domain-containing protein [Spirochaetota bacterium]HPP03530.1 nucleotidyltransferase domain-containing protein [Spirochaetota bacterium]
MDSIIFDKIVKRLSEIEKEHNVEIIYAIESGSRAWGFPSTDSDYDVRFIYKHNIEWYLTIFPKRDVIEYPIIDIFDYSGWDLKKALFLLNKSNPVLFEWFNSPIVYKKNENIFNLFQEILPLYFSPISTIYHYLHMAKGNYRNYLKQDVVKVKKYFYVLRPIFACMWVEKNNSTPPMEFENLLNQVDINKNLYNEIHDLLIKKRSGIELGIEPKKERLNNFIEEQISYFDCKINSFKPNKKPDNKILDQYFIKILKGRFYF